jgi:hypothetical protein
MKKKQIPKRISPEKRMKQYKDFGCVGVNSDVSKVDWTKYKIVVPTEKDRKEIHAAMEYFHDCKETDTDFVTVNQLVHEYEHGDESDKYSNIVVDFYLYHQLLQKTCPHPKEEQCNENGVNYCKLCWKALEITN